MRSNQMTMQDLLDRAQISDVVTSYATALDTRDWPLLRSILTEQVRIDYTSFDPALDIAVPADEWVERVKGLAGFTATQHISANHVHTLDGDEAKCVSYMHAGHFLTRPDGEYACFLYGFYTQLLVRQQGSWKIAECTLTITARQGDARVFGWAFGAVAPVKAA